MIESDIESCRNYFYIEGEPNDLAKISMKARFRGVPMRAKSPDFDWIYDEAIARKDLERIASEKKRMALKFEQQKKWEVAEKQKKIKDAIKSAKTKADQMDESAEKPKRRRLRS